MRCSYFYSLGLGASRFSLIWENFTPYTPALNAASFFFLATIGSLNSTISKESAQVVLEPVALCGGVLGRTVEVSTWWGHQQGLGRTDTGQLGGSQLRPLRIPAPLLTHPPLSWTTTLSTNIRGKGNKVFDFNTVCVQL